MNSRLTLQNPLWDMAQMKNLLDKIVQNSAAELEKKIKEKILDSVPSGKTYRRGAIYQRGRATERKENRSKFARKFFSLYNERFAVAFRFHRASRKGQPPAVDSGGLINSIRAHKSAELKAKVSTGKNYAARLDDKEKLDRPFFSTTAEEFRAKFKENLADGLRQFLNA